MQFPHPEEFYGQCVLDGGAAGKHIADANQALGSGPVTLMTVQLCSDSITARTLTKCLAFADFSVRS